MSSAPTVSLRRNGKRQSCEQCRKMKIKCDHSLPKCSRCVKRDLDCFYDPAPMTRKFRSHRMEGDLLQFTTKTGVKKASRSTSRTNFSGLSPDNTYLSSPHPVVINTPRVKTSGFLGPISYRTVMADSQNQQDQPGSLGVAEDSIATHTIEPRRLDVGLQVVAFLCKHADLIRTIVNRLYFIGRMPILPKALGLAALEHLWDIIEDNDYAETNPSKLDTVIRIFHNSYQPLPITKSTKVDELSRLISGENVRWETICNMVVLASLGLLHFHHREIGFNGNNQTDKQSLFAEFYEINDSLLSLTKESPFLNELVICLKYHQILYVLIRFGESSQRAYSSFVDLTSCIYASGIHQDKPIIGDSPGFIDQWRRRCFATAYYMDKNIATALGRPPQMNRYYCILEPPLDIDDGVTGLDLQRQLRMLDQNGWNMDGKRRPASLIRLRFLLATVREEILELHIGVDKIDIGTKSQLALHKLRSIWQSCPNNIKYSPEMWNSQLSASDILPILWLYLDYLYSTFLIYLTAHDASQGTSERLLLAAKTILSTILHINDERERVKEIRSDFFSVFLPYGLPSAEILTKELLRRPSLDNGPAETCLPRAEVIRELTVYASCLSWVARPGSWNAEYCKEVKGKLIRILDQIINSSNKPIHLEEDGESKDGQGSANRDLGDMMMSWENLFDWDRGGHWDSGLDFLCEPISRIKIIIPDHSYQRDCLNIINRDFRIKKQNWSEERPFVFLAHSFGVMVLKGALASSSSSNVNDVSSSTLGILFFGTPPDIANGLKILLASSLPGEMNESLQKLALTGDVEWLRMSTSEYDKLEVAGGFQVVYFLESPHGEQQDGKIHGYEGEEQNRQSIVIRMGKTHGTMIRFPNAEDEEFRKAERRLVQVTI
ncbi:Regulator of drug sensitivity 1 [Talaromyces islandicus]|uniref:Regulator of drug sensitivity 1 n=1 Tax=Talaromyces islandicus TaxID=28573 RepID=A0A0U1M0J1_TALIS|nr:Regulator of drug sensitivity 1 [Talaromyces islandicus]